MTAEPATSHRIVLIGAGNVAWHLGPALEQAGHRVEGVFSRTREQAESLAARLTNASVNPHLNFKRFEEAIFVVAVADQAVGALLAEATFPAGSVVVHTSGSLPLSVVVEKQPNVRAGVFYPVQTFSKAKAVDFSNIPICVEGIGEAVTELLSDLARSLSREVLRVSSEERSRLHVAAVFACNFTNHLLGISSELLRQTKLPSNILNNLIQETIAKALTFPPFEVQTGPAARGDLQVLEHHRHLLSTFPAYQALYMVLSHSILRQRDPELQILPQTPA